MQLDQYWKTILTVTDTDDPYVRSLRVHMYLDFRGNRVKPLQQAKILLLFVYLFLRPYRKYNPGGSREAGYLFYMPFDTPAHRGNLMPLLQIAPGKGIKDIFRVCRSAPEAFPADGKTVILTGRIPAYVPFRKRFSMFSAARKVKALRCSVKKTHPAWRKEMNNQALKYIYLIYLSMLHELFFRELVSRHHFRAVISTTEYFPNDYQLFRIASRSGIKTFIIQHGIIGPYFHPSQSDCIFTWGKLFHDQLIKLGMENGRLVTGGMPSGDPLFREGRKKSDQPAGGLTIVILSDTQGSTSYPGVYKNFKKILHEMLDPAPAEFLVKLHPSENGTFYDEFSKYPALKILPRNVSLAEAVGMADLAMTIWSTAGLEALIMGKPLLVLDIHENVRELAWWPEYGGGEYVRDAQSIRKIIIRANAEPGYLNILAGRSADFINDSFANQGNAVNAILDALARIASDNTS
jgi:hypothetical protein